MELRIYTIYDRKACIHQSQFFKRDDFAASRDVAIAVNNPQSLLHMYSADYDLLCVGSLDDTTGKINPFPAPVHVTNLQLLTKPAIERKPDVLPAGN